MNGNTKGSKTPDKLRNNKARLECAREHLKEPAEFRKRKQSLEKWNQDELVSEWQQDKSMDKER